MFSRPVLIGRAAWPFHLRNGNFTYWKPNGVRIPMLKDSVDCRYQTERLDFHPGGHRGKATPVPIPNTEVKGPIAEGTARFARGRVGRRRGFYFREQCDMSRCSLFFWRARTARAGVFGGPFLAAGENLRTSFLTDDRGQTTEAFAVPFIPLWESWNSVSSSVLRPLSSVLSLVFSFSSPAGNP